LYLLGFSGLSNICHLAWCAPGARFLIQPHGCGLVNPAEQVAVGIQNHSHAGMAEPAGDSQRLLTGFD